LRRKAKVSKGQIDVSRAVIKLLGTELMKEVPNGLLCKWLPKTGVVASKLRSYVKLDPKAYRQRLVKFRNVVETKMCNREWSAIEYNKIPSKAGFIYRNAFRKQDGSRYEAFLGAVLKGEIKINSGTLYPHEVVGPSYYNIDTTKEAMWKNLPDFVKEGSSIFPMIDVSGSILGAEAPNNFYKTLKTAKEVNMQHQINTYHIFEKYIMK
jgi:hypothetical protein